MAATCTAVAAQIAVQCTPRRWAGAAAAADSCSSRARSNAPTTPSPRPCARPPVAGGAAHHLVACGGDPARRRGHAGDLRLYLLPRPSWCTRDHSRTQLMIDQGVIKPEEAQFPPRAQPYPIPAWRQLQPAGGVFSAAPAARRRPARALHRRRVGPDRRRRPVRTHRRRAPAGGAAADGRRRAQASAPAPTTCRMVAMCWHDENAVGATTVESISTRTMELGRLESRLTSGLVRRPSPNSTRTRSSAPSARSTPPSTIHSLLPGPRRCDLSPAPARPTPRHPPHPRLHLPRRRLGAGRIQRHPRAGYTASVEETVPRPARQGRAGDRRIWHAAARHSRAARARVAKGKQSGAPAIQRLIRRPARSGGRSRALRAVSADRRRLRRAQADGGIAHRRHHRRLRRRA